MTKKLSITSYTDTMRSKLVKKFSRHGGTRAKPCKHPLFGDVHQHTLAFSTLGHFVTTEHTSLLEAVHTFKAAPSVVLGKANLTPAARKKSIVEDFEQHLALFDVEFFLTDELRSVEEIALDILKRLGNEEADFVAIPTASYGCVFEDGTKNSIRLFVVTKDACTLATLKDALPSTQAQSEAWGMVMLDSVIYQPERLIFTQVDVSEFPPTNFYDEEVTRLRGVDFDLSSIPFQAQTTAAQRPTRRSVKPLSFEATEQSQADSGQGGYDPNSEASEVLYKLIELREPSSGLQDNGAERHLKFVHGACSILSWSEKLGYSEEDARQAFLSWVSKTNKEIHVAKGIFGWALENYEKDTKFFPSTLEAIAKMLPNTDTKYITKTDHPDVCALWCSMGSGKTVYSREWIKANFLHGKKTLVVVPRVALAKAVTEDLRNFFGASGIFVTHYRDEDAALGDVIVTTVHSALNFLANGSEISSVVIDEVIQVRKDLGSQPMIRAVASWRDKHDMDASVIDVWERLLHAPKLLVCDAYMRQGNFLEELKEARPSVEIVKHITQPTQQVWVAEDSETWLATVKRRVLGDDEKCFCAFSSKKQAQTLATILEQAGKKVLVLSADNAKEDGILDDVDTSWAAYDAVFTTTAISSGVSFDTPDHFDFVGGYFVDRIGLSVTDQLQMLGRIRKPKTNEVLICASNLAPKGLFEEGDLERQVKEAYLRRDKIKTLDRRRIREALDRTVTGELSIEEMAEATLDLDPSFPLVEKILREEVIGETGHKNFWKGFAFFFGRHEEEEIAPTALLEIKEQRKEVRKAIKEATAELLSCLASHRLSTNVEEAARSDYERAEGLLEMEGEYTPLDLLKAREVWIEENFDGLDALEFVASDSAMQALKNTVLLARGSIEGARTTLEAVANPNITKEAALMMLRRALTPYKKDCQKGFKETWKRLTEIKKKYDGFINKVAGIDFLLGDEPSRRVIHAVASQLGWCFDATLVREAKDKTKTKPKAKEGEKKEKKKRKYTYAFSESSPSNFVRVKEETEDSFFVSEGFDLVGILSQRRSFREYSGAMQAMIASRQQRV